MGAEVRVGYAVGVATGDFVGFDVRSVGKGVGARVGLCEGSSVQLITSSVTGARVG